MAAFCSDQLFDVCVIGAGIEGSATARYLASRGKKTLLLEQFPLPHSRGSSHGSTRLVRFGYREEFLVKIMPEAFKMWADVEKMADKQLIKRVGLLSIEGAPYKSIGPLAANVRGVGEICHMLSADDLKKRYPMLDLPYDWQGTLEPNGGFICAAQALQALQDQFVRFGGVLHDGEKVLDIVPGSTVTITTSKGIYRAKSIIITAGPWVNEVLKPLSLQIPVEVQRVTQTFWKPNDPSIYSAENGFPGFRFVGHSIYGLPTAEYPGLIKIWRVVLCYWKPKDLHAYSPENGFPGFIIYGDGNGTNHDHIYGFPVSEYPGLVKICNHTGIPIAGPEARDQQSTTNDPSINTIVKAIKKYFRDVDPVPKIVEPCLYTVTPDTQFVLDRHPQFRNIVIGAGFSGHGFKMAPVVGKILSEMALGERPSYDLHPFRLSRFKTAPVKSSL